MFLRSHSLRVESSEADRICGQGPPFSVPPGAVPQNTAVLTFLECPSQTKTTLGLFKSHTRKVLSSEDEANRASFLAQLTLVMLPS